MRKSRPSLSQVQIAHLLKLCSEENPLSMDSIELVAILKPYLARSAPIAKLSMQLNANSVLGEIESELAAGKAISKSEAIYAENPSYINPASYAAKEDYWEACYAKSLEAADSLSKQERQAALEHMYLNDLMTPEAKTEFEAAAFGPASNTNCL